LFPDTTYAFDSGGDPAEILDLTHERLVACYKRYYHPSNSRLYFYGDDDLEERLRRLDAVLAEFEPLPVASSVALRARFTGTRRITRTFAAAAGDEVGRRAKTTINWMLDEVGDAENDLALRVLDHILIGTPAAPLRSALLKPGFGEDLAGYGLDQDLRQAKFSVGLKGIAEADADKIKALVLDTLRELAAGGLDSTAIEASINSSEFSLRDQNTGGLPRGHPQTGATCPLMAVLV
jgi:presequence protease